MVIQNSKKLLEHLSEIEDKIRKLESVMEAYGIEVDQERLVRILIGQKVRNLPAGDKS